ncbi:MAG: type III-B CRISPR-associated protein Cas10/Cmr2 [Chitinophagales bacterium]
MKNNHIFILSIGPVQTFIAQARKAQDLFGGSRLLSHLCTEAIDFSKEKGVQVIFPVINKQKSIPNRFVGTINGSQEELRKLGEAIEQHIQDTFLKIAQKIKNEYKIGNVINFDEQIKQHLEIHWIFYPIETNYETDYAEAEKWFGAAKNIRQFQQLPESGRKCSLDGERNVKVYRLKDNEDRKKVLKRKLFQEEDEVHIIQNNSKIPLSLLSEGEGLSAVSFVKRDFDTLNFPSTAKIALMDTLNSIWKNGDDGIKLLVDYMNEFIKTTNFDEQLLFDENVSIDYFKYHGYLSLMQNIVQIRKRYEDLVKYMNKNNLPLQKYYALMVFDGDRMGQIISGKNLKTTSKHKLRDFQKRTSELLAEYAEWAYKYLDNPKGQTIYAGGDDFMGFINLNYLYEAMQELYDQFNCKVNKILKTEFAEDLDDGFNFTFSAGVVITHYKTPLSIVLKKAREMEKLAKKDEHKGGGGRDAFAISVIKHSGESHATVYKWSYLSNIKGINDQLQSESYSNTFIKNIQNELNAFGTMNTFDFVKDGHTGAAIAENEIKRLVERSRMPNQPKGTMQTDIIDIFHSTEEFDNFSQALNIAQFTKRQSIAK